MNVNLDCSCGATMSVDDASELATGELTRQWFTVHPHSDHPKPSQYTQTQTPEKLRGGLIDSPPHGWVIGPPRIIGETESGEIGYVD